MKPKPNSENLEDHSLFFDTPSAIHLFNPNTLTLQLPRVVFFFLQTKEVILALAPAVFLSSQSWHLHMIARSLLSGVTPVWITFGPHKLTVSSLPIPPCLFHVRFSFISPKFISASENTGPLLYLLNLFLTHQMHV